MIVCIGLRHVKLLLPHVGQGQSLAREISTNNDKTKQSSCGRIREVRRVNQHVSTDVCRLARASTPIICRKH